MLNYQFVQKVKLISGAGMVAFLGELVKEQGRSKVFIVYDKGTFDAGIVKKATDSLEKYGVEYVAFPEVKPDPPTSVVERGAVLCKEANCDMVIGIGGGSSIDTAKAINMLRFNSTPISQYASVEAKIQSSPGFVAIPTTSGTGSEVSDGIILTDTENNVKFAVLSPDGIAEFAIIDPELMVTLPPTLTATTGVDALAHSLEAYTSTLANDFTDQTIEKNVENIIKYLPLATADGTNMEARSKMAVAATIGGWMLACAHVHSGHSIAHVLGGKYHVPHAYAVSYSLPYAMEFIAPALPEKVTKIVEMFGKTVPEGISPEELGKMANEVISDFIKKLNINVVKPANMEYTFEEISVDIEEEMFQVFAPRKMSAADALTILNRIFA